METSSRQRNISFDLMRCVAILLVATQHVWSMLDMDVPAWGMVCHIYRALVDAGVPMFVAVSGALLLQESPMPLSDFFSRRLKRVFIPFLIWATVVYGVSVVTHQYAEVQSTIDALKYFVPYLLSNRINEFHWFVWMIMALYLLTPILQRMMQAADSKRMVEYILLLVVVAEVVRVLFPELYLLRYTSPLLRYVGVYVAGYYIVHHLQINRWVYALICMGSFASCLIPGVPTSPFTCLTALALVGLIYSPNHARQHKTNTLVLNVSRYSYVIYLVHIPIIRALLLVFHLTAAVYWPPVLAVLVVLIVVVPCYCADRLLPKSVGRIFGIG